MFQHTLQHLYERVQNSYKGIFECVFVTLIQTSILEYVKLRLKFVESSKLNGCSLVARLELIMRFQQMVGFLCLCCFDVQLLTFKEIIINLLQCFGVLHLVQQACFHKTSAVGIFTRTKEIQPQFTFCVVQDQGLELLL